MKKICFITGTRADYGLLFWTMKKVQEDPELELQLIASSMHLNSKFGDTWKNIEEDGFPISIKVDLGEQEDSRKSVVSQISEGVRGFYQAYDQLCPDLIVILGDRYEMLAAAQSAVFSNISIAHIHGGEITEGAFDDIIRHSITKMSTYHFTSTEEYRKRVIQMGEEPERVLNVGAVGLETIRKMDFMSPAELEEDLGFKLKEKNFLITYHPVTAAEEDATQSLLNVLSNFQDFGQIITLPNSDPGHDSIYKAMNEYAKSRGNVYVTKNLGFHRYLSLMKICDAVIGNSSSGIIEAPYLGTPTLNIGVRQKGRVRAKSVIDCEPFKDEIKNGIEQILKSSHQESELYGDGKSSQKIINFLKDKSLIVKSGFYDE